MKRALVIVVVAVSLLALSAADLAASVRPGPVPVPVPGPLTRARQFGFRVAQDSNLITILPTPQAVISDSFAMTSIICSNCGTACPPFPRTVIVTLQATANVPAGYSVTAMDTTNYTVTSAVQNTAAALTAGDFVTLTITGDVGNCLTNFQVWFDMGDDACGDLPDVFVNELHYNNTGGDVDEGIEVAGPAGTDLAGWSIYLYNGSGGVVYDFDGDSLVDTPIALSGVIPSQSCGFGAVNFLQAGIQNGDPDGFALIDSCDRVVQFLSYGGAVTATNGPAIGMVSTDIGVKQTGSATNDPVGSSLQLTGEGTTYADFAWTTTSIPNTRDAVNTGQTFCDLDPTVTSTTPADNAVDIARNADISITFSEDVTVTGSWFDISCTSGFRTAGETGGPRSYTLNPDSDFAYNDVCTVTVYGASVTDQNGMPDTMVADYSFDFTVAPDPAPTVTGTSPTTGATGVAVNTDISITFSEDVAVDNTPEGDWYDIVCATSGAHTAVTSDGPAVFTLNPDSDFVNGELCTVTIYATAVTDADTDDPDNNMAADYVFTFTTVPPDSAPTVTTTVPTNGATGVSVSSDITINFSEEVSVTGTWFGITCGAGTTHTATASSSPASSYTLNPATEFANGVSCTVTVVAANVTDTDGTPDAMGTSPADDEVFSFTTASGACYLDGVVISEVYGGGGNTGAYWKQDFVELHNRGTDPVNVTGWSVQQASASGTTWNVTALSGTIAAGGYFLVQQAAGSGGTADLPTPDATGTAAIGSTSMKIALVNDSTALSGACNFAGWGARIVDFVGVGSSCYEGSGDAPATSNTRSVSRISDCQDSNDNEDDFVQGTDIPTPFNSSSPAYLCPCAKGN